jgi:TPR repeat protein
MLSKAEVLFFAADPLSVGRAGRERLSIDEEVRQIRKKVRAAHYRDRLYLNTHWAARPLDLLQALNERHPPVVHFSGHGGEHGLVLAAGEGASAYRVDAGALKDLFGGFRGDVRLVVLNACFSLPQARAIAEEVGCAIGTSDAISDPAAITFSASFYSAIAFGKSVEAAFEQARSALKMHSHEDSECPHLVCRADVDPSRLVLIPPRRAKLAATAALALLLTAGGVATLADLPPSTVENPVAGGGTRAGEAGRTRTGAPVDSPGASSPRSLAGLPGVAMESTDADPSAGAEDLAAARRLREAGNHDGAFPLFLRAAEAGSTTAMAFVGESYLEGTGTERAPEVGIRWIRRSVAARDGWGMTALGRAYLRGLGVSQSDRWARHWLMAAAEETENAAAMNALGFMYVSDVSAKSDSLAMVWFKRAADAGLVDARVNVGLMYERGRGVAVDTAEALRWYETAASAGSGRAMNSVGQVYQARRDYARAREWFIRADEAGEADGATNLGVLFYNGWGVRRDRDEARRWFEKAARGGSTVAEGNLAAMGAG